MSFPDAVRTCLTQKYVRFSGRARRSEFWFFVLFSVMVNAVALSINDAFGNGARYSATGLVSDLVWLALLPPMLAVGARRLHDTGRSAWWWLLYLTVVGTVVLLAYWLMDSEGDNQYGSGPTPVGGGQQYQQMPPPATPQF